MSDMLSEEARADLTRAVMTLLNDWGIAPQDQVVLLGLPDTTRTRSLLRYRQGTPLPENAELMVRVNYLLSIERALHTAFPHSASMAKYWITTNNQYFGNRTPLKIMLEDRLRGIERVEGHLTGTEQLF